MRILRLLSFLAFLAPSLLMATDIQSYVVRLHADEQGSGQATATVVVTDATPGTLSLPLGFPSPENPRLVEAPAGVGLECGPRNGMTTLRFHLPEGMPATATLRIAFEVKRAIQEVQLGPGERSTLPANSRLFRHAFVNTQETAIGSYRFEFLFPEDMMAQAIREQLPKPKKSEVGPRVLLTRLDGHQAAILQFTGLRQGDDTSMVVEVVPRRRSSGWLVAGVVLAGLYLVHFKDLVSRKRS